MLHGQLNKKKKKRLSPPSLVNPCHSRHIIWTAQLSLIIQSGYVTNYIVLSELISSGFVLIDTITTKN